MEPLTIILIVMLSLCLIASVVIIVFLYKNQSETKILLNNLTTETTKVENVISSTNHNIVESIRKLLGQQGGQIIGQITEKVTKKNEEFFSSLKADISEIKKLPDNIYEKQESLLEIIDTRNKEYLNSHKIILNQLDLNVKNLIPILEELYEKYLSDIKLISNDLQKKNNEIIIELRNFESIKDDLTKNIRESSKNNLEDTKSIFNSLVANNTENINLLIKEFEENINNQIFEARKSNDEVKNLFVTSMKSIEDEHKKLHKAITEPIDYL